MLVKELDGLRSWEGNIKSLVRTAVQAMQAHDLMEAGALPNVRLVRDYAQRGILSKSERRGKEGWYNFRHLVEIVASRVLVNDGWPLQKVAEFFAHISEEELLRLVPGYEGENSALSVVRRFMADDQQNLLPDERHSGRDSGRLAHRMAAQVSEQRASLKGALSSLGNRGRHVRKREITKISIARWCEILIDTKRLESLSHDDAVNIGRAVTASLLDNHQQMGELNDQN